MSSSPPARRRPEQAIELMSNAIADHVPDITKLGDPRRLRSGWINGIKELQVDYTGKCPVAH